MGDSGTVYSSAQIAQSPVSQPGIGRDAKGERLNARGLTGIILALLGGAAVIGAIIIIDDDDDQSPGT